MFCLVSNLIYIWIDEDQEICQIIYKESVCKFQIVFFVELCFDNTGAVQGFLLLVTYSKNLRQCYRKTNFLFMPSKKKPPELCVLFFFPIFRLYAWRDLRAFIPTGNQPEIFLCQFSPTPQFRQALSPTNPTMKDLSSFSLSTSDIFF